MKRTWKSKSLLAMVLLMTMAGSLMPVLPSGKVYAAGGITQDYWTGVSGGNVSQIPLAKPPSGTQILTSFETKTGFGDNYGSKVYGFLTPPVSGDYTFWIASDDTGELWLSPDSDPVRKEKIAFNTSWTSARQWDKLPTQKSVTIPLKADKKYYIEALHKEATSGDNLSVAWQGPGISRQVIPGSALRPYVLPEAPTSPVHNDDEDTFGWTPVPGQDAPSLYEYSTDRGRSWQTAAANPILLENLNYTVGQIQVRLKETADQAAGKPLSSTALYTMKRAPLPEYPKTLLWRLGLDDRSSGEFSEFKTGIPEALAIPADWSSRSDWSSVSKGIDLSKNGSMVVKYNLDAVPEYGVEFSFRSLDAYVSVPQLAVFSNGTMAGLIQIVGLNGGKTDLKYKETYSLYIPKEMLKAGANELKLELDRGLYAGTAGDTYHWFEWDYAKLEALGGPANEPIHGRYIRMGTSLVPHVLKDLDIQNIDVVKWLGLAYSGNVIRSGQNSREMLTALRDLNLAPVVIPFGTYIKDASLSAGVVPDTVKNYYKTIIGDYGDLFEYLEIDNEPGVFNNAFLADMALAQYVKDQKPLQNPWLTPVAPGWAYWPSKGIPDGWERDPAYRRQVEDLTEMTNGHSYSLTGISSGDGGSLVETLKTYPEYAGDGVAKPMMLSETGANDFHTDKNQFDTFEKRYASIFDRELRSDIGYADYIMQHAAYFREYSLLNDSIAMKTADDAQAHINPSQPDETRLKTFRRLTLAYSTHGKPLPYTFVNAAELAGLKAYFRAVDTSALGVTNTGAKSDKLLLNFVNFEPAPVTMNVKVTMPSTGAYAGERFGEGNRYAEARSFVTLNAGPELELTETLQPGESVQYILTPKEDEAPSKPMVEARAISYKQINLDWQPSTDNKDTAGYKVYDNGQLIAKMPKAMTRYSHKDQRPESSHRYTVVAYDDAGNESQPSDEVAITTHPLPESPYTVTSEGALHYEAEKAELEGVTNHGANVGMYFTQGRINLMKVPVKADTNYVLKVRYSAAANKTVNLLINNVQVRSLELPGTEAGNNLELEYNVRMPADAANLILTIAKSSDNVFAFFDWFELKEGTTDEVPKAVWTSVSHKSPNMYYSSPTFTTGANGADFHETSTSGDYAAIGFKGTGVRWISDIESYLGTAEVYIDDVLAAEVDLRTAGTQGAKKIVFEQTGLSMGNHIVKVAAKDGRIIHHAIEFLSTERQPFTPGPDLIVTGLGTDPEQVYAGQKDIRFYVTVKNAGITATPAGIVTGAAFGLNGGAYGHTDYYKESIAVGESVTLYTNGGGGDGYGHWEAPNGEAGYELSVNINDIGRFAEMDRTNNRHKVTFQVGKRPDSVPPVTAAEADGPTGEGVFSNRDVSVILSATDGEGGTGVGRTEYRIGEGAWIAVPQDGKVMFSEEGVYKLAYHSVDKAGNEEVPKELVVGIDKTVPSTLHQAPEGWQREPVSAVFAAADALSGVLETRYKVGEGAYQAGRSVMVSVYGIHTVSYYSVDRAGNEEPVQTVVVMYDPVAPVIEAEGSLQVLLTDPVQLQVGISDSLSGVAGSSVTLDGTPVSARLVLEPASLSLGDHVLHVTAVDAAGNTAERTFLLQVGMDIGHADDLLSWLHGKEAFINDGIYNSLLSKVKELEQCSAEEELSKLLEPLEHEVNAQKGKGIREDMAQILLYAIDALKRN